MTFDELLESKKENNEEPAITILKGANKMGGHFKLDDEIILFFARYVVAEFSAEPMRVKGEKGWKQLCLIFVENGSRYKLANPSTRRVNDFLKEFHSVLGQFCYY